MESPFLTCVPIRIAVARAPVLGLAALVLLAAACRVPVTTVILVRHAERPPGADPDLNALGRARSESLSVALERFRVDAILHTQFKRTEQTARPLATRTGIVPIVVSAAGTELDHARAVVGQIDGLKGRTVVYVGHSNTVPAVISALGIAPAPTIADAEHFHFFVVRRQGGQTELLRVKYD
jgi:phosphohistidine phosphatase SixA